MSRISGSAVFLSVALATVQPFALPLLSQEALAQTTSAITSFSPTSGPIGTAVVINGSGFSNVSSVKVGGGNVGFTRNSSTQVTATTNSNAKTGPISIQTSNGLLTSSSTFTVTVNNPTISSFSPISGPPDTKVVIQGTYFNNVQSVKIGSIYLNFVRDSETQLTTTTKTGNVSGKVTVTTTGGSAVSSASFTSDPPSITSFTPTNGTAYPATDVTIKGINLLNITSIGFGKGYAENWQSSSHKEVKTKIPCTASTGKIAINTYAGVISSTTDFSVPDAGVPSDVPQRIACVKDPRTPPDGFTAITYWGQAIVDTSKTGEAIVEIDYMKLWCTINGTEKLLADDQGSIDGQLYVRSGWYSIRETEPMPYTYNAENDSVVLPISDHPDKIFHWYMSTPRASWSPDETVSSCRVEGRMKISGPALVQLGADWWVDAYAPWNGAQVNNREMGYSNWYLASPDWQVIRMP
ncbi:IPT/TIG domain-containing protein [Gloeobacter violaceus]|nr:IPT/TIG domain-containing protein [Gloeobacter violaceus]